MSRRSRTRIDPKKVAMPRTCARLTIAYVHGPDSRMTWPSADPCSHVAKLVKVSCRPGASRAIGIDVERLAVHRDPLGLHFVLLHVAIAVAMRRHPGADGEHAVLHAGGGGPRRRRERQRPLVAFGVLDHH